MRFKSEEAASFLLRCAQNIVALKLLFLITQVLHSILPQNASEVDHNVF